MTDGHAQQTSSKRLDALVIEDELSIRTQVSAALGKLGLSVVAFDNAGEALTAVDEHQPKIIFLDVALNQSDAVDVIKGLSERHYSGTVQLFSSHPRLLEAIQRIALRYRLTLQPPIAKPLYDEAIAQIVASAGLRIAPASAS
jgi:DNA-binding NtrC family response regulator